jgi:hypothetical protein
MRVKINQGAAAVMKIQFVELGQYKASKAPRKAIKGKCIRFHLRSFLGLISSWGRE